MPSHTSLFVVGSLAAAGLLLLTSCGGSSDVTAITPELVTVQAQQQAQRDNQSAPANTYTATLLPVLSSGQPLAGLSTAMGTGIILIDPQRRLLRASVTTTELAAGANPGVTLSQADFSKASAANSGTTDTFTLRETAPGSGVWTVQQTLNDAQLTALQAGEYQFQLKTGTASAMTLQGQVRPALPGGPLELTAALPQKNQASHSDSITNTTTSTTVSEITETTQTSRQETQVSQVQAKPVNITTINGQTVDSDTVSNHVQNDQSVRLTMLTNVLSHAQQLPAQQSTARAVSVVILDQISGRMRVSLTSLGADGTAAHVHQGTPGTIGPTLFALAQTAADSGIWSGTATLNTAQTAALLQGSYYLDLHTAAAPQGLLRGQILQQGGVVTITGQLSQVSDNDNTGQRELTQGNSSVIQQ